MEMQKIYPFSQLATADLIVDALYKGGKNGNAGDDPISKLVGCGNQGGFRFIGGAEKPNLIILYSDMSQPDWPDEIDDELGYFYYFGDNRKPGHELHDTKRKGNLILRTIFNALHINKRDQIPPILIFTKGSEGRDVIYKGLAVPGADGVNQTEDLIAVWKVSQGQRFQNYRAIFTVLDIQHISRRWIDDVHDELPLSQNSPKVWLNWKNGGAYRPLKATRTLEYRKKNEQLPKPGLEEGIIKTIIGFFKNHPQGEYAFEKCAAEIVRLMDINIANYELTRPWRDGGRDAIGIYRIGMLSNAIKVDFALEAKCHLLNIGSGIKETSRLISRLRHRQFGIFVTTSYLDTQAYKEIIEDQHPVIVICGSDIANILIQSGISSVETVTLWLETNFKNS